MCLSELRTDGRGRVLLLGGHGHSRPISDDLLQRVKQEYPEVIVLVVTAYGTIESAMEAMRIFTLNGHGLGVSVVARSLEQARRPG